MVSVACFGGRVKVMFHLIFVHIFLVRFGLLSGQPLGNSCPLGLAFVFCLFVIFIYFPFWFKERDLAFVCSSSCSLLFYYYQVPTTYVLEQK